MDDKTFLGKRRDRAIATLLGYKEQKIDQYLPDDVARKFRREIMDKINDLCDLAFDLMSDDVAFNEDYLNRVDELDED